MMMKHLKVIACEVAFRELCYCASQCSTIIDFTFMSQGLHNKGSESMKKFLQDEIDKVDTDKYDTIILAYGLCSNGVVGLQAKISLVIPKAHDCITFFLGSKEKYSGFFNANRGTYLYTSGWIERGMNSLEDEDGIMARLGINKTYEEYVEEFGEENAEYIMEMLGGHEASYDKIALIDTKVGNMEYYREKLHEKAESTKWTPIEIEGDNSLLLKLLNGDWDENNFTVVPPNHEIVATNDENIIGFL